MKVHGSTRKQHDFHTLWQIIKETVARGKFGDSEIAEVFSAQSGMPLQVALRDKRTGRVRLVDWHYDGTFAYSA